jgi:hypothetical protein
MADPHRYRSHRIPHGPTATGVIRRIGLPPGAAAHDRALGPGSRAPPARLGPGAPRGQPLPAKRDAPALPG